jgi:hypothetical protein
MKKISLLIIALLSIQAYSQENWFSGSFNSNAQYYLDDDKTGDFNDDDRFRSNNYLKLDARFVKPVSNIYTLNKVNWDFNSD